MNDTSKSYFEDVAGYKFHVIELDSGYISFGAPFDGNTADRAMFDNLTYYHQKIYNGKTEKKQAVKQAITNFIADWKKSHKHNSFSVVDTKKKTSA